MRPVRDSARMQRNRAALNSTPRPEIAAHIKENFVGLDVVVDPRDFYRFRMCIEEAWRERANNVSANLEGLMNGGRLMDGAGDRLKILRVESKRIQISVPTHGIERMMGQGHARKTPAVFHQNIDIFLFVDRDDLGWCMKIALRLGRAHIDLAFVVQVTLWNSHGPD
jgi:hypothetical protein